MSKMSKFCGIPAESPDAGAMPPFAIVYALSQSIKNTCPSP